jgi:hypothetical protein
MQNRIGGINRSPPTLPYAPLVIQRLNNIYPCCLVSRIRKDKAILLLRMEKHKASQKKKEKDNQVIKEAILKKKCLLNHSPLGSWLSVHTLGIHRKSDAL